MVLSINSFRQTLLLPVCGSGASAWTHTKLPGASTASSQRGARERETPVKGQRPSDLRRSWPAKPRPQLPDRDAVYFLLVLSRGIAIRLGA